MQLAETRFVRIDGTEVTAAVDSADQAKIAIKELRHKKREVAHQKKALQRQKRAAEAQAARARRKKAKPRGFIEKTRAVIDFVSGVANAFGRASAIMDIPKLEREIARSDELMHNIDTVILKIQGKLIHT